MSVYITSDAASKPSRGMARRRQILDVAVEIFAREGYQAASIDKICKGAGIARGTLYQYFADKRALFREILANYASEIEAYMQPFTALGLELPRDPEKVLLLVRQRIRMIFELVNNKRDIYRILLNEAVARTADTADLVARIDATFRTLIATELAEAAAAGVVQVDDPDFTANFIIGALLKSAQAYLLETEQPRPPDEIADRAAELVIAALFRAS